MSAGRRFIIALAILLLLTAAGTAGYIVIEGMSLIDALYMSVMTISTVGFGEVKPLSPVGRLFTIGLIVTGVGTALYVFTVGAELLIEGRLRDYLGKAAMERKIHQLENHVIVCGYGRFGKVVAEEVARNSMPVVVVERAPDMAEELARAGLPFVIGSALDSDVLDEVGIREARAIVIATASDADNVYITLSAREKNPALQIHARAESEAGAHRLKLAGADQVLWVYQWGAFRMAASIVRPSVVDFLELSLPGRGAAVDLEEIRVVAGSPLVGKTIKSLEDGTERLKIVAVKKEGEELSLIPDPSTPIGAGDYLVVIGESDGIKKLTSMLAG
jgi:voltage-gated potassium channel